MSAPEPAARRVGEISCDEVLFERLRGLRKQLADERGVPSYIVFSDVSLRLMARTIRSMKESSRASAGSGTRNCANLGRFFWQRLPRTCKAIRARFLLTTHLRPRLPLPGRARLGDTARETLRLFRAGAAVEQIAAQRNLTTNTIYGHLADIMMAGESIELERFLTPDQQREIAAAFEKLGTAALSPVFEALGGRYDYGRLRLARAALKRG